MENFCLLIEVLGEVELCVAGVQGEVSGDKELEHETGVRLLRVKC